MLRARGLRCIWSSIVCTSYNEVERQRRTRKCVKPHTYRFRSELETSSFAPTIFRKIFDIISSLNITISWSKNLIRHGFDAKWILGILFFNLLVKLDMIGRRGSIELSVKSCGPGTSTKCAVRVIGGYCAIRSASASKPSCIHIRNKIFKK